MLYSFTIHHCIKNSKKNLLVFLLEISLPFLFTFWQISKTPTKILHYLVRCQGHTIFLLNYKALRKINPEVARLFIIEYLFTNKGNISDTAMDCTPPFGHI